MEIGDRVLVVLSSTPEEVKVFGEGTYQGDQPIPDPALKGIKNPKLVLDNGAVIWGFQCWWGDIQKMKDWIGTRRVVKVDTDELT